MSSLHHGVADAVARAARPLLLSGDCPSARAAVAGLRIGECLAPACATTEVAGAGIACAWLPDRVGDRSTRETITRLAGALGAGLEWHGST